MLKLLYNYIYKIIKKHIFFRYKEDIKRLMVKKTYEEKNYGKKVSNVLRNVEEKYGEVFIIGVC